jgi:hypothetical protein
LAFEHPTVGALSTYLERSLFAEAQSVPDTSEAPPSSSDGTASTFEASELNNLSDDQLCALLTEKLSANTKR